MTKHIDTSPKKNKVIVVYNRWFFTELLRTMQTSNIRSITDASGTVWDIIAVKGVLSNLNRKVKQ